MGMWAASLNQESAYEKSTRQMIGQIGLNFFIICALVGSAGFANEPKRLKVIEGQLACFSPNGNFFAYLNAQNALEIEGLHQKLAIDVSKVGELFQLLDSERFHERNRAFLELKRLGNHVERQLTNRLQEKNSLEVQERLKALQQAIRDSERSVPIRKMRRLIFSPNDEYIAVAGDDRSVTIWRSTSRQKERIITSFDSKIHSLAFSIDGRWLAIGTGNGEIFLYDMERAILHESLLGHKSAITDLAFSADQRFLYSAGGSDLRLGVWDTRDMGASAQYGKRHVAWLTGHKDTVVCLAISPDGKRVISGGYDQTLIVWDTDSHLPVAQLHGHINPVRCIVFSGDSQHFVSAADSLTISRSDQTVRLWSLATSSSIATLNPDVEGIQRISVKPNSNEIAVSGSSNRTVTWEWDALDALIQ